MKISVDPDGIHVRDLDEHVHFHETVPGLEVLGESPQTSGREA